MKIKKTIKEVLLFNKVGQLYVESVKGKENKLSEAIKIVQKRIAKTLLQTCDMHRDRTIFFQDVQ